MPGRQVHAVYPAAKIDVQDGGLLLHTSPPPVVKTGVVVKLPYSIASISLHRQQHDDGEASDYHPRHEAE
jgi:hypothetical protein